MISATHLHAIFIHFPIALLFVGYFSEIIGFINKKTFFKNVSLYLLLLGVFGVITAYISGSYAGDGIESGSLKVPIELHENAALMTLLLAIINLIFIGFLFYFKKNTRFLKRIGFLLYSILIISVTATGYLGGQLVYKHGAGIELALPDFNNPTID